MIENKNAFVDDTVHLPKDDGGGYAAAVEQAGKTPATDTLRQLEKQLLADRKQLADLHINSRQWQVKPKTNGNGQAPARWPADEWHRGFCLQPVAEDTAKGKSYGFEPYAWSQFLECAKIPIPYAHRLFGQNPDLLSQLFSDALKNTMNGTYLLRVRGNTARAFLPQYHNRLDNLYIVRALIDYFSRQKQKPLGIHPDSSSPNSARVIQQIWCDGDDLVLNFMNPNPKTLLKSVGDKAVSGIRIRNSDIGRYASLSVATMFVRLVCTNGMVSPAESSEAKIPRQLRAVATRYRGELPPDNIPVQDDINAAIAQACDHCFLAMPDNYRLLQNSLQKLRETKWADADISNKRLMRALIEEVLHASGMRLLPGVSAHNIYEAAQQEAAEFPATANNAALLIYNALTRYASSPANLTNDNADWPARRRGRPATQLSRSDRWQLSGDILRRTPKLLRRSFDWQRVYHRAQKSARIIDAPTV